MLLQQLAVDYAERFRIDSLEMYEAMIELWRVQTNQSAQVTPMNGMDAPKVKIISACMYVYITPYPFGSINKCHNNYSISVTKM